MPEGSIPSPMALFEVVGRLEPVKRAKPPEIVAQRKAQNQMLSAAEDGALLAGGLLAVIGAAFSGTSLPGFALDFVVFGLVVAAGGKAIPSLVREVRDQAYLNTVRPRPMPDGRRPGPSGISAIQPTPVGLGGTSQQTPATTPGFSEDPAYDGDNRDRAMNFLGDGWLLAGAAFGLGAYAVGAPLFFSLAAVGAGFVLKALFDLVGDAYDSTGGRGQQLFAGGPPSPRSTENLLFLFFGASAVVLACLGAAEGSTALALGIAAAGKSLGSLPTSKSSSDSDSSDGKTSASYLIVRGAPPPASEDL